MHICAHTHAHTHTHTDAHTHRRTHTHMFKPIYISNAGADGHVTHTHKYIYIYIHIIHDIYAYNKSDTHFKRGHLDMMRAETLRHTHYRHTTYIHTYIHTHTHTYIHTNIHTYIHKYTYIHTYIYTIYTHTFFEQGQLDMMRAETHAAKPGGSKGCTVQ